MRAILRKWPRWARSLLAAAGAVVLFSLGVGAAMANPPATATSTTPTATTSTTPSASGNPNPGGIISDTLAGAIPATFTVGNQQVTVTFPNEPVAGSFQIRFSTQPDPGSTATPLTFQSAQVFLNNGVAHLSRVKSHGRIVTTTVYTPNATTLSSSATVNVSLAGVRPSNYTCRLQINYTRNVGSKRVRATLPYTSRITEPLTVTGG